MERLGAHVGSSRCRISPPRFLAESRNRRLNQGSFVSAVCLVVYFLWFILCLCVFFWFILSIFLIVCLSVMVKWLAVKTASKMTRWGVKLCSIRSIQSVYSNQCMGVCVVVHICVQLSLFVWNSGAGIRLTEVKFLCGYQRSEAVNSSCSVWLSTNFPQCVSLMHVYGFVPLSQLSDVLGRCQTRNKVEQLCRSTLSRSRFA